jgi:hypothetical protein
MTAFICPSSLSRLSNVLETASTNSIDPDGLFGIITGSPSTTLASSISAQFDLVK